MKRVNFKFKSTALVLLALGLSSNLWGQDLSKTCTVTSTSGSISSPVTISDVSWTIATTAGAGSPSMAYATYSKTAGMKFGSSKSIYYGSVTLSTTYFNSYNVKSVVVNALNNGSKSTTLSVSQGSITIGSETKTFGTTWTNLTANAKTGTGGTLSLTYSVQQAFYIHSISITYTAGTSTYTVTCQVDPFGYGSVSQASVEEVASGTSISANGATLSVGSTNVTASVASQTAQYTYNFTNWTWTESLSTVTKDITATANFTRSENSYNVSCTGADQLNFTSKPTSAKYSDTELTFEYTVNSGFTITGVTATMGGNSISSDNIVFDQTYTYITQGNVTGNIVVIYTVAAAPASTDYYYRGADNSWGSTKMTEHESGYYSYIQSSNSAHQFKISTCNEAAGSWTCGTVYNCSKVAKNFLGTDVNNIGDYSGDNCYIWQSGTYYILIFKPNTDVNGDSDPKICAATELPLFTAGGNTAYFANDVTQWSNVYFRIGRQTHNNAPAMTKVSGTANLYKAEVAKYDNYVAFAPANNSGWTGNNSIYLNPDGDYHFTGITEYQKYTIDADFTLQPTTGNTVDGVTYWAVNKTSGMLTHTATITAPSNGIITVAYTDVDNSNKNFTSGSKTLAHTCNLTITAAAATGFECTGLTVNGSAFTSGNVHVLIADATIAATFTALEDNYVDNLHGQSTTRSGANYDIPSLDEGDKTTGDDCQKSHYHFMGWSTDSYTEGKTKTSDIPGFFTATGTKTATGATYYAVWAKAQ